MTVPWSARLHHLPHDYTRFTRFALHALLSSAGYTRIEIAERGNDVAVLANKLIVLSIRLIRPARNRRLLLTLPLCVFVLPITAVFLVAAHVAIRRGWGATDDPLGYSVVALKA